MTEMITTGKGAGMLSVSVSKAGMPQFQLLIKLSQLRRQGVSVAKPLAGDLESTCQNEDFGEQQLETQPRTLF